MCASSPPGRWGGFTGENKHTLMFVLHQKRNRYSTTYLRPSVSVKQVTSTSNFRNGVRAAVVTVTVREGPSLLARIWQVAIVQRSSRASVPPFAFDHHSARFVSRTRAHTAVRTYTNLPGENVGLYVAIDDPADPECPSSPPAAPRLLGRSRRSTLSSPRTARSLRRRFQEND